MPIYDFICPKCKLGKENIKMSYEKLKAGVHCEKCGGLMVQVYHPTTTIFKGDGWAKDGYVKNGKEPK